MSKPSRLHAGIACGFFLVSMGSFATALWFYFAESDVLRAIFWILVSIVLGAVVKAYAEDFRESHQSKGHV